MAELQPMNYNKDYKPQGYRRLTSIICEDKHLAIFRRFDEVNIVLLMALQAEIVELQRQFQLKSKDDDEKGLPYSSSFHALRQSAHGKIVQGDHEGCVRKDDQFGLLESLRSKMIEYNTLLLQGRHSFAPSRTVFDFLTLSIKPRNYPNYHKHQASELSKLPTPQASQLLSLQNWLKDPVGGAVLIAKTEDAESHTWDHKDVSSYITLRKPDGESDLFTQLIMDIVSMILHPLLGRFKAGRVVDLEYGLTTYSDSKLIRLSNLFAVVVSSALPVLTIFVLNTVKSTNTRLGLTVVFTVMFAVALEVFTSAKRVEIFAATAT
ncbi:hypothetical protein NW766_010059 [Fusarium irregulare]|uniref:DUF6594 domain-containing protein n=1 Tax=Fusarium irregulare TaxID=2494466 RepID=A0A9W8PI77_9HYPO|nr:hypothetical protein NW766_010059 [Fusarium irregulare]